EQPLRHLARDVHALRGRSAREDHRHRHALDLAGRPRAAHARAAGDRERRGRGADRTRPRRRARHGAHPRGARALQEGGHRCARRRQGHAVPDPRLEIRSEETEPRPRRRPQPMIRNPILPGFNADPSICRVGRDYYIATSTFEWYPGVQIHHSTDLVNWRLAKRPLERAAQLDMRGNPDSCGIWAPCLSFADSLFWLVYTDVKRYDGNFKDSHNYIVTAPAIEGPWSDPVYVNSSGFDPSLCHDDDGRKWFVNMLWNHVSHGVGGSPKHPSFAGIVLQE